MLLLLNDEEDVASLLTLSLIALTNKPILLPIRSARRNNHLQYLPLLNQAPIHDPIPIHRNPLNSTQIELLQGHFDRVDHARGLGGFRTLAKKLILQLIQLLLIRILENRAVLIVLLSVHGITERLIRLLNLFKNFGVSTHERVSFLSFPFVCALNIGLGCRGRHTQDIVEVPVTRLLH